MIINAIKICTVTLKLLSNKSKKEQTQGADLPLLSQRAKKKTERQARSARQYLASKRDI
jgi:hypothetical protein